MSRHSISGNHWELLSEFVVHKLALASDDNAVGDAVETLFSRNWLVIVSCVKIYDQILWRAFLFDDCSDCASSRVDDAIILVDVVSDHHVGALTKVEVFFSIEG